MREWCEFSQIFEFALLSYRFLLQALKYVERRKLALMFTDIVGYSRLMGQDEDRTIALLGEYRRILVSTIEQYSGTVIEFIGDAVFARFDSPLDAVNAGVAIQDSLFAFNREGLKDAENDGRNFTPLNTRIGIHYGKVAMQDEASFGDDVNIAARLEPIAVADTICISKAAYDEVKDTLDTPTLNLGKQNLKNIQRRLSVFILCPRGVTANIKWHYALRSGKLFVNNNAIVIAACFALVIMAGIYLVPRWLVPGYDANYVEVADFTNLNQEDGAKENYFSEGITAALRSQLSDIRQLFVVAPDEGIRGPVRLEGSIQKFDDRLRIVYRLIRREDKVQFAGGKLDGAMKDIFILQDRMVAEIANYLSQEFRLENFRPAPMNLTTDVRAYDYYLQGEGFLRKPTSHSNLDAAIQQFNTALTHDQNFAQANAGICSAYRGKYILTRVASWATKAVDYCLLALEQNDELASVYQSLGELYGDLGRFEDAERVLKQAIELDHNAVDASIALANVYKSQNLLPKAERMLLEITETNPDYWGALQALGTFYLSTGKMQQAVDALNKVLSITPENAIALSNLGTAYTYMAEYRKGAKALSESVALIPSAWGYSNTGAMYYFAGNFDEAVKMFKQALRLSPNDYRLHVNLADALRHSKKKPAENQQLALRHYRKSLDLAKAALALNDKDFHLHQYMAISRIYLGEEDEALQSLEAALRLSENHAEALHAKARLWIKLYDDEKAAKAVQELISKGYPKQFIEADPDFKNLLNSDGYQQYVAKNAQ